MCRYHAARDEDMVDRVEMTWVGHVLFPVVLCVADPALHEKPVKWLLGSTKRPSLPRWLKEWRGTAVCIYLIVQVITYVRLGVIE